MKYVQTTRQMRKPVPSSTMLSSTSSRMFVKILKHCTSIILQYYPSFYSLESIFTGSSTEQGRTRQQEQEITGSSTEFRCGQVRLSGTVKGLGAITGSSCPICPICQ